MALTQVDQGLLGTYAQYTGFKNRIINGAMSISQRGTSFSSVGNSGSTPTYTLDRWSGWRGGWTANMDISQQTGWGSYNNCLRMQRTSGTSSTAGMNMAEIIESINIYDCAGQNVTCSLGMRAGSNYSGGQVTVYVMYSTAADQTSSGLANGTWTGSSSSSQAFTISSTGTQYSFTAAVPANALSMAVQVSWTPTGTAGTNDYIEFTGVQLEKGSTATSFDYRPYGTELALCQRYCWPAIPGGVAYASLGAVAQGGYGVSNNTALLYINFPTLMRASPTLESSGVQYNNSSVSGTPSNISLNGSSYGTSIQFDGTSNHLTLGSVVNWRVTTTSGYLRFIAEL